MKKYAVEFIGTFFLVLTIGCTGIAARPDVITALAIGSVLMVMIYAGGHVSGAHYNPAVTVAVFLRGRCAAADVVPYWIGQLAGTAAAAAILLAFKSVNVITLEIRPAAAFASEFFFTFALAYVVLNVATAKATAGNSCFGLAIGFTVLAGAFCRTHFRRHVQSSCRSWRHDHGNVAVGTTLALPRRATPRCRSRGIAVQVRESGGSMNTCLAASQTKS